MIEYTSCQLWTIINSNFVSSLLGGLLGMVIFWFLFQEKIRKLAEFNQNKRVCENFIEALIYNKIVAEKNLSKTVDFTLNKKMTILKYSTEPIDAFLSVKPIDMGDKFYGELQVFNLANLKSSNMLLKIFWFAPELTEIDRNNAKKELLENSKKVNDQITNILNNSKLTGYMRGFGLTDDVKTLAE